jgi:hypothetical protein
MNIEMSTKYQLSHNDGIVVFENRLHSKTRCSTYQRSMATEMPWVSLQKGAQGQIPHANGSTHSCVAKSSGISAGPCTKKNILAVRIIILWPNTWPASVMNPSCDMFIWISQMNPITFDIVLTAAGVSHCLLSRRWQPWWVETSDGCKCGSPVPLYKRSSGLNAAPQCSGRTHIQPQQVCTFNTWIFLFLTKGNQISGVTCTQLTSQPVQDSDFLWTISALQGRS